MRNWFAAALVVASSACATQTFAQHSTMSSDQILKALTPPDDVSKGSTRGIKMSNTPPVADDVIASTARPHGDVPMQHAAAAKATVKTVAAAPSRADGVAAVNLTVNFALGSAELTPQAIQALDALGMALSSETLAHYRFRVEGHTDTVGTPESNRVLSEQRAETVVRYITAKYGVAGSRLEAAGLGSDKQLVATGPQVSEPRNRRVQVVNLGG